MDDLTMWSLVVGTLLPPLVAVIQQPRWPDWLRATVTVLSSVVAGGVTAYLSADLEGRTWVSSALVVLVAAMTTYRNFWKQTGIAQRIEVATSPGGAQPDEVGGVEINVALGTVLVVVGLLLWLAAGYFVWGLILVVVGAVLILARPLSMPARR